MRTKPLFLQRCLKYRRTRNRLEKEEKHGWDRIRLQVQEIGEEEPRCLFVSSGTSYSVGGVQFFNPAHAQIVKINGKEPPQEEIEVKLRIYSNGKGVAEDGILFLVRMSHPASEFARDRMDLTTSTSCGSGFGFIGQGEPVLFGWMSRGSLARSISSTSPLELSFLSGRLFGGMHDHAGKNSGFTIRPVLDTQSRLQLKVMPRFLPTPGSPATKRTGFSTCQSVYFRYLYNKLSECKMDLLANCGCPFCGRAFREYRILKIHLNLCHDLFAYGFSDQRAHTPTINVAAKPPVYTNGKLGFYLNRDGTMDFLWASKLWTSPVYSLDGVGVGSTTPARAAENGRILEASTPSRTSEEKTLQHQASPVDGPQQAPSELTDQLIFPKKVQARQYSHKQNEGKQRQHRRSRRRQQDRSDRTEKGKGPAIESDHVRQPVISQKRKCGQVQAKTRMFYHSKTCQLITKEELESGCPDSDDEEDFEVWLESERRSLDEFIDVNETEKQFMHLWNAYVHLHPVYGDIQVPPACQNFAKEHQENLSENEDLRQCFVLFLVHLFQIGLINQEDVIGSLDVADGAK